MMKKTIYLSLFLIGLLAYSCKEDDAPLPDNTVNFSTATLGFDDSENAKTLTVNIDRKADVAVNVTIDVTTSGVEYATDFTTTPAVENNTLTLTIPAGATSANIIVNKVTGLFDGDETITFTIRSVSAGLKLGSTPALTLQFGTIISEGATLRLEGGGSAAPNSVFADLSSNEGTAVDRKSWHLGFSSGNDFAVILNNVTSGTAVESSQTNIDGYVINDADSTTLAARLAIGGGSGNFDIIDDLSGDLTKTVIKEGKVYVVSPGESQPWFKVKVTKKDNETYTLQYARLKESTSKTLEIKKDAAYNFVYASLLENKVVPFEPAKVKWDIVWTKAIYKTAMGGTLLPYAFSDLVFINAKGGVKVAKIETSAVTYEAFTKANINSDNFSSDVDAIGGGWRSTMPATGIIRTHFYVIQDPAGNYYKLRFKTMGVASDGGERGRPEIEYALLK